MSVQGITGVGGGSPQRSSGAERLVGARDGVKPSLHTGQTVSHVNVLCEKVKSSCYTYRRRWGTSPHLLSPYIRPWSCPMESTLCTCVEVYQCCRMAVAMMMIQSHNNRRHAMISTRFALLSLPATYSVKPIIAI